MFPKVLDGFTGVTKALLVDPMTCTQGRALGDPQTDIELPISQHTDARDSVGMNFIHTLQGVHGYSQTVLIYNIVRFNIDILAYKP